MPGKFKDELNSKQIKQCVGLRSKMYSFPYEDSDNDEAERKKANGVAKATIEHNLRFEMYKATFFDKTEMMSSMDLIRSHSHNIYCETVRKKT